MCKSIYGELNPASYLSKIEKFLTEICIYNVIDDLQYPRQ